MVVVGDNWLGIIRVKGFKYFNSVNLDVVFFIYELYIWLYIFLFCIEIEKGIDCVKIILKCDYNLCSLESVCKGYFGIFVFLRVWIMYYFFLYGFKLCIGN